MKFLKLKKMGSTLVMALAFCVALFATGCTDQEPVSGEAEVVLVTESSASELSASEVGINTTASFTRTCDDSWYVQEVATGHILEAWAWRCRKFGSGYVYNPHWFGRCTGDVSNCNGRIVCQATCP